MSGGLKLVLVLVLVLVQVTRPGPGNGLGVELRSELAGKLWFLLRLDLGFGSGESHWVGTFA